jgi:DNA-binding transcriptional MerR regulator
MPPIKSKFVTVNGEKVEVFYINELAYALGRDTQTVRKWEIAGVIPKSVFKDSSNRRMYSREQIDLVVKIAEECKIKQGLSIANTSFSARVHREMAELNKKYINKK